MLTFNEIENSRLFGHEAAEDEVFERLREYYFKSEVYDQIKVDLPLRILVGHKGIGKSALFKVAMHEESLDNRVVVFIRPDDILDLNSTEEDLLKLIRIWKNGLIGIICGKVLRDFSGDDQNLAKNLAKYSGKALAFLADTLREKIPADLVPTKKLIIEGFLKKNSVSVYIDDLDRGWSGSKQNIKNVSAMLNAIRDIANENPGIFFKISLRSDVYFLVRTSDESTDKIEGSVVWQAWDNFNILVMLIFRIETFFGRTPTLEELQKKKQMDLLKYLAPVFEIRFQGHGNWENIPIYRLLTSLIRKRPRDLVKLCTLAAKDAHKRGSNKIGTANFEAIFEEYSQGRLQDTINEFKSELPAIERLLVNMKANKKERKTSMSFLYTTADLLEKIRNIQEQGDFLFANGKVATEKDLAGFLYKINFITARKELEGKIVRKFFEESRYLVNKFTDFGFDWEVHPAYRWALNPNSVF